MVSTRVTVRELAEEGERLEFAKFLKATCIEASILVDRPDSSVRSPPGACIM